MVPNLIQINILETLFDSDHEVHLQSGLETWIQNLVVKIVIDLVNFLIIISLEQHHLAINLLLNDLLRYLKLLFDACHLGSG